MKSGTFQWLLAVSTLLGGLAALFYFSEKFRQFAFSNLRFPFRRAPNISISPSTLGAYINTNPRPRQLGLDIAQDFGCTVERTKSDWEWLNELCNAVGVESVRDLDSLVKRHRKAARLLARSFQPSETISSAHGVQLALEIEAMNKLGLEDFVSMLGQLTLTSAGAGYAREIWDDYQRIVTNGA